MKHVCQIALTMMKAQWLRQVSKLPRDVQQVCGRASLFIICSPHRRESSRLIDILICLKLSSLFVNLKSPCKLQGGDLDPPLTGLMDSR